MKTTVFTKHHIENEAKMAEFAGYNMPIEFSGINRGAPGRAQQRRCIRR